VPALYALAVDGLLPERFTVIGAARSELTDDQFRAAMRDAVTRFARLRLDEEVWSRFAEGSATPPSRIGTAASTGSSGARDRRP